MLCSEFYVYVPNESAILFGLKLYFTFKNITAGYSAVVTVQNQFDYIVNQGIWI